MVIAIIRFGSGRPNVCIICEYDALPGIGHACGHNLIAEAGVAAGLGVKAFIESQGTGYTGMVTVMGTPAEEGGGGKVLMIEKGAFEGVDIAIMAHPCPFESVVCIANARMIPQIDYHGNAAHAAAFPWEGVNALDAAVMAYTSISTLRQQMKPSWRVHGVFTNGGVKPNIIPEKASLQYYIRAPYSGGARGTEGEGDGLFQWSCQGYRVLSRSEYPCPNIQEHPFQFNSGKSLCKALEVPGHR